MCCVAHVILIPSVSLLNDLDRSEHCRVDRRRPCQTRHMAILHDVVVDCRRPASLARFWAAAVDGYRVAPYDDAELERLRANGVNDPEDDPSVLVESDPGLGPSTAG